MTMIRLLSNSSTRVVVRPDLTIKVKTFRIHVVLKICGNFCCYVFLRKIIVLVLVVHIHLTGYNSLLVGIESILGIQTRYM